MNRTRLLTAILLAAALSARAEPNSDPLFEIPFLDGIVIDGRTNDWGENGFRVEVMKDEEGRYLPATDFDAGFRLGWNTNGLLVLVHARDDAFVESPSEAELWKLDGVEMFMATRKGGPDMVQPCFTPGMDPSHPSLRWHIHDYRQNPELTRTEATATAASMRTPDGYVLEACLPWTNLGLAPRTGDEIGFQIYVSDADGPDKKIAAKWFPRGETHADTRNMHRVILSTNASPAILAAASGSYEKMRNVNVTVLGASELAGREIALSANGTPIATNRFLDEAGRAVAHVKLPVLPDNGRYPPLAVECGDRVIATLELPDPAEIAAGDLIWSEFILTPFSFVGERLPDADFKNPCEGEQLIGPYSKTLQFYDADGNAVTAATRAGRYGAVLQIEPASGRPFKRFLTAYRQPDAVRNLKPWKYDPHAHIDFPPEFGLKSDTLQKHAGDVNQLIRDLLLESTTADPRGAMLLAGLNDAQSKAGSEVSGEEIGTLERQWWVNFKRMYYNVATNYPNPFVCPRPNGTPAPILRTGTVAEAGVASDAVERIDALLRAWSDDTDEAFAVCLARHGVVFFHQAYGMRDGKPMTVDTTSWMASITKLMSGTLMMMMVDQGLVGLDDPVGNFLPAFRGVVTRQPLTVRHLYTHATGLSGHWGDEMNDLEERIAYDAPYLPIGERFQYNGAGFALGGKIIEMVSGECIPLFYKHHLLGPLGMTNTDVRGTSGDASSTPMDMAHLGQMLLNRGAYGDKRFLSESTFVQMLPQKLTKTLGPTATKEYGIGTDKLACDTLGDGTFGHGAASAATFLVSPSNDLVVVMCRNAAGRNFDKYHPQFLRTVAGILPQK